MPIQYQLLLNNNNNTRLARLSEHGIRLNLSDNKQLKDEHLVNLYTNYTSKKLGFVSYKANYLNQDIGYEALKNDLSGILRAKD